MISNYLWEYISIQKGLTDFILKALEAFADQTFKNQGVYFDFKEYEHKIVSCSEFDQISKLMIEL